MRGRTWIGLCMATVLWLGGCGKSDNSTPAPAANAPAAAPARITLAVIPKGTTHIYWKTVQAGAQAAANDLGVDIQWKGPLQENDRAGQIEVVEQFISQGVSGIVLAPLDDVALVRPVREAVASKIPVVIMDSALQGDVGKDFVSFVATDNRHGGEMAGQQLAKLLNGKGNVVLLRYLEGSASTRDREEGFLSVMAQNPGITVTVSNRYGGPTAGDAKTVSLQLIDQLKQADGIFCSNEPTVFGMLLALRESGLAGKVKFVGFDTSADLINALKAGEIDALISQDPRTMGYDAVQTMVQYLRGQQIPQRIDSGAYLVTRDNLDSPEIKKLLVQE
jgi:ribose transport system substrate-binding protein